MEPWFRSSWRKYTRTQAPKWYNNQILEDIQSSLEKLPALVFSGETQSLIGELQEASEGNAFILQCGNCAENFMDCNGTSIQDFFNILLQMSTILSYTGKKKIVKIGRIAGQYAKPRSSDTETINGINLPVYRGDMVNSFEPVYEKRRHDPARMLEGYFHSAATLNLIRSFAKGGYSSLEQVKDWKTHFFADSNTKSEYKKLASELLSAVDFMKTIGAHTNNAAFNQVNMYTSHEALLLEYEEAMTRQDKISGLYYDTSAHMLWVGDRTRQPHGAYIEFLKGLSNPVGIKIGPTYKIDEILQNICTLNPANLSGKICLIVRFGVSAIERLLTKLIREVKKHDYNVIWLCDPMHGNTYISKTGKKTRNLDDILGEIELFFQIHKKENTIPGGLHLELTPENVNECLGGTKSINDKKINNNYTSTCDPRLNAYQSVELAFFVSELLKGFKSD